MTFSGKRSRMDNEMAFLGPSPYEISTLQISKLNTPAALLYSFLLKTIAHKYHWASLRVKDNAKKFTFYYFSRNINHYQHRMVIVMLLWPTTGMGRNTSEPKILPTFPFPQYLRLGKSAKSGIKSTCYRKKRMWWRVLWLGFKFQFIHVTCRQISSSLTESLHL